LPTNSTNEEELTQEQDKTIYEEFYITSALYEWYLQQKELNLTHNSTHRSHFCLLMLIQKAIFQELVEHSQDRDSFVLADKYKDTIKCNSASFNQLLNFYFDLTVEAENTGKKKYANGYKLKDKVINEIFDIMLKDFENNNALDYVEIKHNEYSITELYITQSGYVVDTKKEALFLDGLTRRQENKLTIVKRNILKKRKVNKKEVYKTDFYIPKGYYKYPIVINEDHLLQLIKNKSLDKGHLLFYINIINIYRQFPFAIYKQISTGRLSGTTKINNKHNIILINYQGMKKVYRHEVFKAMYEYDISTSAPSILLTMFKKSYTKELAYIQDYIDNKQNRREEWAKLLKGKDLEHNIKTVKSALTALFFGAELSKPYLISKEVKKTITTTQLITLLADEKFKYLVDEVVSLFNQLVKIHFQVRKDSKKKVVENAIGIKKEFSRKEKKRAIAFIYQGIEVQILLALYKKYNHSIVLLIHDAIISTDKLDPQGLSETALEASGYNVGYEESKLV
jgi:hypothetical protein